MLNITVSSGASRAELIAAHSALAILINPEYAAKRFDQMMQTTEVHVTTEIVSVTGTENGDPGDEQPGTDAEAKAKRTRRTKAQIEADRLAEAAKLLAATPAPAATLPIHGTVSSADTTAPLNPPFLGAQQPAAPAASAAAGLFSDPYPVVSPPADQPATLADLQALVNDMLAVDAGKGIAAATHVAQHFNANSFKSLDASHYNAAAKMLRDALAALKVAS